MAIISAAAPNVLGSNVPPKVPFRASMRVETTYFDRHIYRLPATVLTTAAPFCLFGSTTNLHVNDAELQALRHTGSSDSYVSQYVRDLYRWKILPCDSRITKASNSVLHRHQASHDDHSLPKSAT